MSERITVVEDQCKHWVMVLHIFAFLGLLKLFNLFSVDVELPTSQKFTLSTVLAYNIIATVIHLQISAGSFLCIVLLTVILNTGIVYCFYF